MGAGCQGNRPRVEKVGTFSPTAQPPGRAKGPEVEVSPQWPAIPSVMPVDRSLREPPKDGVLELPGRENVGVLREGAKAPRSPAPRSQLLFRLPVPEFRLR